MKLLQVRAKVSECCATRFYSPVGAAPEEQAGGGN
jgi:hypothetical protein